MKWLKDPRVIMLLILGLVAEMILNGDLNGTLGQWLKLLMAGDVDSLKTLILELGVLGPATVILLLVIQAVIPPIPAFVIIVVAYWVYGPYWGFFYSFVGSQLGAIATFWISRFLGRPFVVKWVGEKQLYQVDYYFDKYGGYAVFLARMVPVLSVDAITYAAGASSMGFKKFMIATSCGQIPALLIFALMGNKAASFFEYIGYLTIVGMLAAGAGYLFKRWTPVARNQDSGIK